MRKNILNLTLIASAALLSACSGDTDTATADGDAQDAAADAAMDGENSMADADASAVLDANGATAEQLAAVDGISAELAQAIIAARPYASVTELNTLLRESLAEDEAANVLVKIFIPVNLNTASREELDLIPGMTGRMAHEFEEYRPYENMEEFNREIGKYVDEAEVARFRNYVAL